MASVCNIPQLNKLTLSLILSFILESKMFTWYYADQLSLKFYEISFMNTNLYKSLKYKRHVMLEMCE